MPPESESPAGPPFVLEARGVTKRFGAVTAVDALSLGILAGQVTAILGPSGSGKSTLLRCLNFLETPDAGEVRFEGTPIRARDRELDRLRARVGMVFQQVATLNQGIVAGDAAGQNVNALGDQRRAAVDTLATLIGSTATTQADGSLTVRIGGIQLVSGDNAQTLATTGSAAGSDLAVVTASGTTIGVGGSIGANIAAVDTTIAGYQSQLSAVADSLAGNVNSLQANGLDAAGDPGQAIAGSWSGTVLPDIFVTAGSTTYTPGGNSAATIAVSAAYAADPSLIATAAAPGAGNANVVGTATLDGTNAQVMAALASSTTGPDATYRGLIGTLGSDAANATTAATTAANMASTAAANVASASGVNQNQEEIDVLSAQNAFQAASKAISAVTDSFQSLLAAV